MDRDKSSEQRRLPGSKTADRATSRASYYPINPNRREPEGGPAMLRSARFGDEPIGQGTNIRAHPTGMEPARNVP